MPKKAIEKKELEQIKETKPKKTTAKKVSSKKPAKKVAEEKVLEAKPSKTAKPKSTKKTVKKVAKKKDDFKVAETVPELEEIKEETQETVKAVEETSVPEVEVEPVKVTIEEPVVKEEPKKKKHPILVALGIILALIVLFAGYILIEANNVKSMETNFDDINVLKAAYVDPSSVTSHEEGVQKAIESAIEGLDIDVKTGEVTISASKGLVYNIVDLDIINDAIKEYGVTIDKFGYSLDSENQIIDAYASAKKWFITVGIHAQLGYEFTENEIILTIKDVKIGNLPEFLYKSFVPKDVEIGRFDISKIKVSGDYELKVFSPNKIKDVLYENNTVSFKYAISDVIDDVVTDLFKTEKDGSSKIEGIANDILDGLGLKDVKFDDIVDIINGIVSLFQ